MAREVVALESETYLDASRPRVAGSLDEREDNAVVVKADGLAAGGVAQTGKAVECLMSDSTMLDVTSWMPGSCDSFSKKNCS